MQVAQYLQKWSFYYRKYGALHAAAAFVGRKFPWAWTLLGRAFTRPYLRTWMEKHRGRRLLNLGGGGNVSTEWLTADIDPRADVFCDLTKRLPFEDGSIDGIILEEVIEHINYGDARALLLECCRILRPDGPIRVSTPDLAWIVGCWERQEPLPDGLVTEQAEKVLEPCSRRPDSLNLAAINATFYGHGHRFIYDEPALGGQLSGAGFHKINFGIYKDPRSALGIFDTHADRFNHPPELSLYVEACKPAQAGARRSADNLHAHSLNSATIVVGTSEAGSADSTQSGKHLTISSRVN